MLDVIADFWKPVKKVQPQEKLQEDQLQVGSSIGFGFVPQSLLSGRRLTVSAINTYQFGAENLTSYVLSQDREPSVSMIVADADGEQYLAISRRIPLEERGRLFDAADLENSVSNPDATRLACKDNVPDFKSWLVSSYKREIHGMKGRIYKGDHRKLPLPATSEGHDFAYTLLVSDSNEHALEIEKYNDGRLEVYATIYRRINDVGEISHPVGDIVARPEASKPDIKLATKRDDIPAATALLEPVVVPKPVEVKPEAKVEAAPAKPAAPAPEIKVPAAEPEIKKTEEKKPEVNHVPEVKTPEVEKVPEVKTQAAKLPEAPKAASAITVQAAQFTVPESKVVVSAVAAPEVKAPVKAETPVAVVVAPVAPPPVVVPAAPVATVVAPVAEVKQEAQAPTPVTQPVVPAVLSQAAPLNEPKQDVATPAPSVTETPKEKNTMPTNEAAAVNGASHEATKPTLYVHSNAQEPAQSVRAISRPVGQLDNDSIECDLRVANKLIDEAIRNEMRLNDVVRRVIELPVANPESVQIPVTLTDEDYSLLAIRYGIPASDRNAIKRRIIEDLNDFSGEVKA